MTFWQNKLLNGPNIRIETWYDLQNGIRLYKITSPLTVPLASQDFHRSTDLFFIFTIIMCVFHGLPAECTAGTLRECVTKYFCCKQFLNLCDRIFVQITTKNLKIYISLFLHLYILVTEFISLNNPVISH